MKKIFNFIKKFVLSGFTLFAFNMMASPININIPINMITIALITIFGILTLPFLVLLKVFFL